MHPHIEHSFRNALAVIRMGLSGCRSAAWATAMATTRKSQASFQEAAKCLTAKVEPQDPKFACENSVLTDFISFGLSRIQL